MKVVGAKATMARQTMASIYCLHEALLQLDPSANTPLYLPHPASLSEAEVVAIAPVSAASMPRIAANMGQIAMAASTGDAAISFERGMELHNDGINLGESMQAGTRPRPDEAKLLNAGDMFGNSPPPSQHASPAAIAPTTLDKYTDTGDIFGDSPPISPAVGLAPMAEELLDAGDMFGDSNKPCPHCRGHWSG